MALPFLEGVEWGSAFQDGLRELATRYQSKLFNPQSQRSKGLLVSAWMPCDLRDVFEG